MSVSTIAAGSSEKQGEKKKLRNYMTEVAHQKHFIRFSMAFLRIVGCHLQYSVQMYNGMFTYLEEIYPEDVYKKSLSICKTCVVLLLQH